VSKDVKLVYMETKSQVADFLTKALSCKTLLFLMNRYGMASVGHHVMQVSGALRLHTAIIAVPRLLLPWWARARGSVVKRGVFPRKWFHLIG
jgi:hypothetical protein